MRRHHVCAYLSCNWAPECDGVGDARDDEHREAHEEGSNHRVQRAKEREHEGKQPQEAAQWQSNHHSLEEVCLVHSPVLLPNEIEGHDVESKCHSLCQTESCEANCKSSGSINNLHS